MSSHNAQAKEPLIRMVKRDTMPQKKAWGIRCNSFYPLTCDRRNRDPHAGA